MKQTRISRFWGGTMLSFSHLALYLSGLNLGLLSITTYQSGWVQEHIWADINFLQFIGGIAVIIVVGLLLVSRLHVPMFMASWNRAWWNQENPARAFWEAKAKADAENQERLEKKIEELKKDIHDLRASRGSLLPR